ncbi:hypothetical protein ACQY0O_006674 [Thecaphora frezii]
MPQPSHQTQHAAGQQPPIGRSQSAFNFLLSKAKIPFSSSSSSSLNTSNSLSSLSASNDDPFVDSTNHLQYHRQLQQQYPAPHGPSMAVLGRGPAPPPPATMSTVPRSSTSDSYSSKPGSYGSRPSMSDEAPISSPTKRGFFGGMVRDRKMSNASAGKSSMGGKNGYGHSPLGRGLRQDSAGSSYALFSKSQSDLHARTEFPSPNSAPMELPKIPSPYAEHAQNTERGQYLRSPSPVISYSRSVDDLASADQPSSPFPPTPNSFQEVSYTSPVGTQGNWGEQGLVAGSDWRPSDMGTLASPNYRDVQARPSTASSKGEASSHHVPLSAAPSHQMGSLWPTMPPPSSTHTSAPGSSKADNRKHSRKSSKLNSLAGGREGSSHGKGSAVAGTLAMSLGLASIGGGQPSSGGATVSTLSTTGLDRLGQAGGRNPGLSLTLATLPTSQFPHAANEPVPLPPGAIFQGFLARNTNISLSLAQLTESEGSKGKEKDISKGWKPYRVVLQDGKLLFYKPPSNVSDEVKALFPTTVVWTNGDRSASGQSKGSASSYAKEIGMDASALMNSGLGKNELLLATSSNKDGSSAQNSPSFGPARYKGLAGRRTPVRADSLSAMVTAEPEPISPPVIARANPSDAWAGASKHPALWLVEVTAAPSRWVDRIQRATVDALADEFVRATQVPKLSDAEAVQAETDAFAATSLLAAASSSPRGLARFLAEVTRLAEVHLDKSNQGADAALRHRLALLVDVALGLGFTRSERGHTEPLTQLKSLAQLLGPGDESPQELEAADSRQDRTESRPPPVNWLEPDPHRLNSSRPELEAMFTARTIAGEILLKLDPLEVAQQIQAFHSDKLRNLAEPSLSALDLVDPEVKRLVSAFSFDSQLTHHLTRLVLVHLIGDTEMERGAPPASTQAGARYRASLLRHWIAVASYLMNLGDVAGWLAVAAALCSRAVTRLEQTWRYLAEGDRLLVAREWAPQLAKLGWAEGIETQVRPLFSVEMGRTSIRTSQGREVRVVPFFGNAPVRLLESSPALSVEGTGDCLEIAVRASNSEALLNAARQWAAAWRKQEPGRDTASIAAMAEPIVEYQLCLQVAMQDARALDPAGLMQRSFLLEPKALGNIGLPSPAAAVARAATASYALVPLLFPGPLPHLSLLDASKVHESAFGPDRRARQSPDPYATITARTLGRSGINGSPLVRSVAFSPTLNSRSARGVVFASAVEWSQGGTTADESTNLIRIGNELTLRMLNEPCLSVPSSPMTGKRFSQDFGRSNRPLSQISKRSSLPASNRSSVIEVVVPLQVVVKAATLERMIDVLVMGVQHINVKNPEETIIEGAAPRRTKLSMDMESYRSTFLATFRSLCSPRELFEHLRKRFDAAINASKEMALLDTYQISSQYPSWVTINPAGSHVEPIDWEVVSRIRMGVVISLRSWIDRFPQDFADDDTLYQLVHAFVRDPGMERNSEDPDQAKVLLALAQINGVFSQSIMSANARSDEKSYVLSSPVYAAGSIDAIEIDFDSVSSEELVNFLESIATVFFDKIVERDLLVVTELFEKQAAHPTAWYAARHSDLQAGDEDKPINSMYSLLDVLKVPGASSQDPTVQQRLPAAVRDALAAQSLLRGWVAIHIIERGLGVQKRQARLEKLLDAVWICRARMSRLRSDDSSSFSQEGSTPFREATIASFVESAILGSLTSSESRIFLRAWQGVALDRGSTGDSLADLFPAEITPPLRTAALASGTPDIGWILTCLAEATTRAALPPDSVEANLVDFEQRRTIWGIIEGAVRIRPPCNTPSLIDLAGARLKAMQSALSCVTWDRRAFREDAAREASQAPPLGPQSSLRQSSSGKALPGLSRQQQEKLRRDRAGLIALDSMASRPSIAARLSSVPTANERSPSPSAYIAPAPATSSAASAPPDKATIRARRMTALFRGAVRPLIPEKAEPHPARTVEELMRMTPTQKPSLVAGLGGAQLAPWNNSQRSFVLHLTSEEGAKYLLQAPNQSEMNQWYTHISRIAKERAPRRPVELRKGGLGKSNTHGSIAAPLYGIPLPAIVEREGSAVPMAIEKMFAEIEARGLREQGIYRISGAKSAIEGLRDALNKQPIESINLSTGEFSDVNTIAGAIKHWFRDLPEPVITFASYDSIIAAERIENHDERLSAIREIIWALPKCHFDLLRRTAEHLARVVDEGKHNLMAPHNIGLVFGTSLLNPPPGPSSVALSFGNLGKAAHIVKIIVTMHEWLFEPEPEPEAAAEPEPEPETLAISETQTRFDADTLHEEEEEEEKEEEEGSKAEGRSHKVLPDRAQNSAAMRRHTYMLGGFGLGAEQLKQLQNIKEGDGLTAVPTMQRSLSSDSEPLTPADRYDGTTAEPSPMPSPLRHASSPRMPAPATSDEEGTADAAPSIVLTSTEEAEEASPVDDDESSDDQPPPSQPQQPQPIEPLRVEALFASPGGLASPAVSSPPSSPLVEFGEGVAEADAAAAPSSQARARPKRAREGFRDSVFSSYSIYADCFDNLNLGPTSASSRARMGRTIEESN